MSTRPEILSQIRHESNHAGLDAALAMARAAIEAGHVDLLDVPEIFLALRGGSWRSFEEPGRLPRRVNTEGGLTA